jgi:phospholipid/cholesterol/gamma-HCH transport system substrate-binding protein
MALAALIIIFVLAFTLAGDKKLFAKNDIVYTYMDDAVGLSTGAPVRLNGLLAGKVKSVELSGESTPLRVIRVALQIQRDMLQQIPVDSVASVAAENVLGTKFINIRRGQSPATIQPGAEIKALDTRDFDEIVQQSYNLLSQLQGIIKRVDAIVGLIESGRGSIGKLLVDEELYNRVISIVSEFQGITHALATPKGTIGKLLYEDTMYNDLRGTLGRVDTMVADLQAGQGTAGKFLKDDTLYNELRDSVRGVRKVVDDLNAGKGTAGKLLKDEQLHDQLRASLGKVDNILDKINSGQGTVGQLLVNPQLYDTLNGATSEMRDLIKAIRQDPKKYLRIKLALF